MSNVLNLTIPLCLHRFHKNVQKYCSTEDGITDHWSLLSVYVQCTYDLNLTTQPDTHQTRKTTLPDTCISTEQPVLYSGVVKPQYKLNYENFRDI